MKTILIIFFTITSVYASHIKWQGDYAKALQQAREENKVLMVLLIKNNCKECKDLVRDLFVDKPYVERLNKETIAVIVNIDNKYSFPIEMYWSKRYPTLFFVNSSNEVFFHEPLTNITQKDIEDILTNFPL